MAHAARVDENNVVREVHVINNHDLNGGDFNPENELTLNGFQHNLGLQGKWLLTSYNNAFRGTYAGVGFPYDPDLDEFVVPVPEVAVMPAEEEEEVAG